MSYRFRFIGRGRSYGWGFLLFSGDSGVFLVKFGWVLFVVLVFSFKWEIIVRGELVRFIFVSKFGICIVGFYVI